MPELCLGENGFILGQPWHDLYEKKQILDFAKEERFKGIELHPYYEHYKRGDEEKIRKEYERYGLEIPCIQTGTATMAYSPISPDEEIRNEFVKTLKEWIEFAHALGATVTTLSPPQFTFELIPAGYTHEDMVKLFIDTCSQIVETAEKNGVVLALEPEPPMILNGGFFRKPIDDVLEVLDQIKSKNFKILYDVTQINVLSKGNPVDFLKALKGRVGWTHIADNDGSLTPYLLSSKHMVFGEGNINIEGVIRTLKETCPHLEWLEVDVNENPTPFETAKKNKKIVESILKRVEW
jgi:sugar phosphate isomerase/epimerase